jgi:hypothetical protein
MGRIKREYIWAILALGIAIVLAYVLVSVTDENVKSQSSSYCVDERTRSLVRDMAMDSFDTAFRKHVEHLFDIWVKDPAEQPKRASRGMQLAISAYVRARSDALKWDPQICSPD